MVHRRTAAQGQPYRRTRPKAIVAAKRAAEAEEAREHYNESCVSLLLDEDTRARIVLTVEAGARFDASRGERRELAGEQAQFQAEYDAAFSAAELQFRKTRSSS